MEEVENERNEERMRSGEQRSGKQRNKKRRNRNRKKHRTRTRQKHGQVLRRPTGTSRRHPKRVLRQQAKSRVTSWGLAGGGGGTTMPNLSTSGSDARMAWGWAHARFGPKTTTDCTTDPYHRVHTRAATARSAMDSHSVASKQNPPMFRKQPRSQLVSNFRCTSLLRSWNQTVVRLPGKVLTLSLPNLKWL